MRIIRNALTAILIATFWVSVVKAHEDEESGFADTIIFDVGGEEHRLEGSTEQDELGLPGHEWLQISETEYFALHHNVGPRRAESWWATETAHDELIYVANVVIDVWTPDKADDFAKRGYVYYHPLVHVDAGTRHAEKVAWFQHIAVTSFNLDGGPQPLLGHEVVAGVDRMFMPNWSTPYDARRKTKVCSVRHPDQYVCYRSNLAWKFVWLLDY